MKVGGGSTHPFLVAEAPETDQCGCAGAPRRVCDACYSSTRVFLACSGRCLASHLAERHPEQAGLTSAERARLFAGSVNERITDSWQRYAPHRHRIMQLVEAAGTGGKLAVFGAGNGSDLELDWLLSRFDEVHLIDLDPAALERARARQADAAGGRLVLHGGVDLSGLLGQLDVWGEDFPEPAALGQFAVSAARKLSEQLGRFDVTLSTCVLSQLGLPFRRAWVASRTHWAHLTSTLMGVHLATLAGTTARAGVLVCDVQTSQRVPELDRFRDAPGRELAAFVSQQVERGALALNPDPRALLGWLEAPGLRSLVASPRVVEPWLWDLSDARQLVYGLTFRHPAP